MNVTKGLISPHCLCYDDKPLRLIKTSSKKCAKAFQVSFCLWILEEFAFYTFVIILKNKKQENNMSKNKLNVAAVAEKKNPVCFCCAHSANSKTHTMKGEFSYRSASGR